MTDNNFNPNILEVDEEGDLVKSCNADNFRYCENCNRYDKEHLKPYPFRDRQEIKEIRIFYLGVLIISILLWYLIVRWIWT